MNANDNFFAGITKAEVDALIAQYKTAPQVEPFAAKVIVDLTDLSDSETPVVVPAGTVVTVYDVDFPGEPGFETWFFYFADESFAAYAGTEIRRF